MTLPTTFTALRAAGALCACLLAAPAVLAQAMPPADGPDAGPGFEQLDAGAGGPFGGFGGFGEGMRGAPPFLRGLDLSEEQQDRVFAILHAQAPKRRELHKAERKAFESLRELARAPQLDEARASASAQALGQAIADQELLRLQTGAQIKAVLTPAQRAQLDAPRGEGRKGRGDKASARAKQREAGK
ncbi:Spy/CpxP family protein refolding chaperone [Massilia oculi]|uniref:Spy/CpxP family protein refolding chaperone n=1 Tax=Massilia oculi TaxID=945844 RepID=UPI0028ADA0FD|nr:Spy/CpxP family protein refolding chaperone [Massilia oculi]